MIEHLLFQYFLPLPPPLYGLLAHDTSQICPTNPEKDSYK